jgi:dipeptidyl aminopeptidase/acylaminoacyl peptidase
VDITTQAAAPARMPWRQLGILALIGVLLITALAVYVGTQPDRPPAPFGLAENGRLVYVRDGDLYVRDRVDSPERPLVAGPDVETWGMFSLLGDRLAVFRAVDGGEDLWVSDADGRDLVRIGGPFTPPDWAEWSPDGAQIALASVEDGIPRIDLVATDGSGARRLVDFPAMAPSFRPPDGHQLLFRGQEDGRWSFYLIDLEGGAPMRLDIDSDPGDGEYDLRNPNWSPTGDRLAFEMLVDLPVSQIATPGLRIHIASVGPAGEVSDLRRLEFDPQADDELYPTFTPDGAQIIFQQRWGPTPPDPSSGTSTVDLLFIAPVDGRAEATPLGVVSTPGAGFNTAVAPDGTSLIVHLFGEVEDWLVDPVAKTAQRLDLGSTGGVSWQRKAD